MKVFICLYLLLLCFSSLFSQQTDIIITKDGNAPKVDVAASISFPSYFKLTVNDFKQQVTAPFHQTGKTWVHIGIYSAAVATFAVTADEPIQRFASTLDNKNKTTAFISRNATLFGGKYEIYTLAALGGYGFVFNNKKMQTTTLLATQAYITSGLIESIAKDISGRQRPLYYDPKNNEPEPAFHGLLFSLGNNSYHKKISTSFPSGHTTVAFAVATVFAKQYNAISWVPAVAYSAASLVGLSRITENKHWATDVIVGATLGYLCGSQTVNNYRRYSAKKNALNKGKLFLSLHYNGSNFEPALLYSFK